MKPSELKKVLEDLGYPQTDFAVDIGVNPRTVRSWISGKYPVPKMVDLLIDAWVQYPELIPPDTDF